MTYVIEVGLLEIRCHDTESIFSSDKAGFLFVCKAGNHHQETACGPYRLNDGQSVQFDPPLSLFSSSSPEPVVGLGIIGIDADSNDGWHDSETARQIAVKAVSIILSAIPMVPVIAGAAWDVGMAAIQRALDEGFKLDKNDTIFRFSGVKSLDYGAVTTTITHKVDDPTYLTQSRYSVKLQLTLTNVIDFGEPVTVEPDDAWLIEQFRWCANSAQERGYVGGFITGQFGGSGLDRTSETIFLPPEAAELHHVSYVDLGNPDPGDFGAMLRATSIYAKANGFIGGYPTFVDVINVEGSQNVAEGIERQSAPQGQLGNIRGPRFGAAGGQQVGDAANEGPIAFQGSKSDQEIGDLTPHFAQVKKTGLVLIKSAFAEHRDVPSADFSWTAGERSLPRLQTSVNWARAQGYFAGLPTGYPAPGSGSDLHGVLALKDGAGISELTDV